VFYTVITRAKKVSSEDEENTVTERDDTKIEMDEVETESDHLVSKRKIKVFVWNYFGFETDGNSHPICVDLPKCRLCQGHTTVAAKDPNTSNLYSHLKASIQRSML